LTNRLTGVPLHCASSAAQDAGKVNPPRFVERIHPALKDNLRIWMIARKGNGVSEHVIVGRLRDGSLRQPEMTEVNAASSGNALSHPPPVVR
jgi:hypothetical protein